MPRGRICFVDRGFSRDIGNRRKRTSATEVTFCFVKKSSLRRTFTTSVIHSLANSRRKRTMRTRNFVGMLALAATLLLPRAGRAQDQDFSKVQMKVTKVS